MKKQFTFSKNHSTFWLFDLVWVLFIRYIIKYHTGLLYNYQKIYLDHAFLVMVMCQYDLLKLWGLEYQNKL